MNDKPINRELRKKHGSVLKAMREKPNKCRCGASVEKGEALCDDCFLAVFVEKGGK